MLHLRNTCGYYGAERCIVSWIEELTRRGHAFDLAVYEHPDPSTAEFLAAAADAGARVHRLPRSHARGLEALVRVIGVIRSRGIAVIHAHDNRSHGVGWLAARLTGIGVMGTVHGYVTASRKARRMNAINRRFLERGRLGALTVPSRRLLEDLTGAELMPNAAPTHLADGPPAVDDRPDPPAFGVVARLSREKGVHVFLDAIAGLPADWTFEVVGDGAEGEHLARHPQASRVGWPGFRSDAARMMRAWTALVIPSLSEGLPITLLEAMAQGVPVIASRTGGIPEVLEDGADAVLVPPGDPAALTSAMRAVVADPESARRRALHARERFRESYTLDRVGDTLERLYRNVAGSVR